MCEYLYNKATWNPAQLYSVNVPVKTGVSKAPVTWTKMLQNQWKQGACFQEITSSASVDDPATEEAQLRKQESRGGGGPEEGSGTTTPANKWAHRHFKWAPRFTDVYESVERNGPGSDGWSVKEGETSITALKANFSTYKDVYSSLLERHLLILPVLISARRRFRGRSEALIANCMLTRLSSSHQTNMQQYAKAKTRRPGLNSLASI